MLAVSMFRAESRFLLIPFPDLKQIVMSLELQVG